MTLTPEREQQLIALIGRVEELEKRVKVPSASGGDVLQSSGGNWKAVDRIPATMVAPARHSGSLDDMQDFLNSTQSSGKISGGAFTDNADGSIAVAAGKGFIRSSNSATEEVEFFSWAADSSVTLTDNSTNYIIVTHASTPTITATTTKSNANNRNVILIGKVYRNGTDLHLVEAGLPVTELARSVQSYLTSVNGEVVRASGEVVGETGERYLTATAGVLFAGLTRLTTSAQDTSGTDTFTTYYYDGDLGTPAWVEGTASQIDNANYNDIATGLDTLTTNRYGVHWVYGDPDGHMHVVYGQGDYVLNDAELAQPPSSLPSIVSDFCFLAAKVIVQEGEANLYAVESAYDTLFTPAAAQNHGELTGLSDDDHPQYILHSLADAANDFLLASGADTFVKKTLAETGAILEGDIDHGNIQGLTDDDHTQYIRHNLSTAASDFLIGSGSNTFIKKTLAETKTILGLGGGGGYIETGGYTGDGTTDQTVSLSDSSLAVDFLMIILGASDGAATNIFMTTSELVDDDADGLALRMDSAGNLTMQDNKIISLGTGNFHVDDSGADVHPNANGRPYYYIAIGTH